MKKFLKIVSRWLGRIILGVLALLVLVFLLFYLFRGKIVEKVVDNFNKDLPGELLVEKINLRPFMYFPDISLELNDIRIKENKQPLDSIQLPVLELRELYLSLDVVKLLKGKYDISKVRLEDGRLNYLIYEDSISNLERALDIRFAAEEDSVENENDSSSISLDLESLQLRRFAVAFENRPGKDSLKLLFNGLESSFSYGPDSIAADLMMHLDLQELFFEGVELDKPREMSFSTSALYEQAHSRVTLGESLLNIGIAMLDLRGVIELQEKNLDLDFSAENRGIELLNFVLNGVLDMNAIEQIGEGNIELNGELYGSFDKRVPELNVWFDAQNVGIQVHSINQALTDIGFSGYFTNGTQADYSEALFDLDNFHMQFPQGSFDADLQVQNLLNPEVEVMLDGNADLSILDEIIQSTTLTDMSGNLVFSGNMKGAIDKKKKTFLDEAGSLIIEMEDVKLKLPENEIESLNGTLYLQEDLIGIREMEARIDSNLFFLEASVDHLLSYFFGFRDDPSAKIKLSSRELFLYTLLNDSIYADPYTDLDLSLDIHTSANELEGFLEEGLIPGLDLKMHQFRVGIPGYAEVKDLFFDVKLDSEKISIEQLYGKIGNSPFNFNGKLHHYMAFLEKDSLAKIILEFDLGSTRLSARDLFTFDSEFTILPAELETEQLRGLRFEGKLETMMSELLSDKDIPDLSFKVDLLRGSLKNTDIALEDVAIDLVLDDSLLKINDFKGRIGNSDLDLQASLFYLLDSTKNIEGQLAIRSDMLDLNELMGISFTAANKDINQEAMDSTASTSLSELEIPSLDLTLDVGELLFEENRIEHIYGGLRANPAQVIFLDSLSLNTLSGGRIWMEGQFAFSDPEQYTFSAKLEIDTLRTSDIALPVSLGDTLVLLEDHFTGKLSGNGIGEFYMYPDFSVNMDRSTAVFYADLRDGRVMDFTPLNALARFTGNKELTNLKFGRLTNPRGFTLVDGVVNIPLMQISSDVGMILIEGEQDISGDFLYLLRAPSELVRSAAWNWITGPSKGDADQEREVQEMKNQKFYRVTVAGIDGETEVKLGDKRDKYIK